MPKPIMNKLKEEMTEELLTNILPFWITHTPDDKYGGFYGEISNQLAVNEYAPKSLVLNTRILWTFSAAYRLFKNPDYLNIAKRAFVYILNRFADREYGGMYWMLNHKGEVEINKKQTYGQAFAIYAFAEYYRATLSEEALKQAVDLFKIVEAKTYDSIHGGYYEAFAHDWTEIDQVSLSDKDLNEKKSMNTHLHVLEAYTCLYRVWPDAFLRQRLIELIHIMLNRILDRENSRFFLFFDEAWTVKSNQVSFGHDIEGSWLLYEAADAAGDHALLERVRTVSVRMSQMVLEHGQDTDGGIYNELDVNHGLDTDKHWWPQAEAIVGFFNAYELSEEDQYVEAAWKCWQFTKEKIIDRKNGEWFWKVSKDGEPDLNQPKVDPWKCPYHNSRACFEIFERVNDAQPRKGDE